MPEPQTQITEVVEPPSPDTPLASVPAYAPSTVGNEGVMTRGEAARSRKPGLRELFCRCWAYSPTSASGYWLGGGGPLNGINNNRDMAKLRSVEDAIRSCGQDRTLLYIEGLSTLGIASSTDPDAPQVKVKKCAYPMFIDSVLKQMLMSAPTNETFRARLMAKVGEMPPKEADTWQKLVEWVEWNFPKAGSTTGLGPITASCRYRETELGRCYYSRIMRSHGVVAMTPDMIKDCANAAEDNGQFWEFIHDKFMELAERITQAEEPCTMTTSDYDPSDAKDKSWDYDKRALELKVRTCLGQILSSEQIEDLEL